MNRINDGGPAFPEAIAVSPTGDVYPGLGGMSLRAALAMQALSGSAIHVPLGESRERTIALIAQTAVAIADATIAELAKTEGADHA